MSWTFRNKIIDFVPRVATTALRQHHNFQKKSHHHHKQKIARVATALADYALQYYKYTTVSWVEMTTFIYFSSLCIL